MQNSPERLNIRGQPRHGDHDAGGSPTYTWPPEAHFPGSSGASSGRQAAQSLDRFNNINSNRHDSVSSAASPYSDFSDDVYLGDDADVGWNQSSQLAAHTWIPDYVQPENPYDWENATRPHGMEHPELSRHPNYDQNGPPQHRRTTARNSTDHATRRDHEDTDSKNTRYPCLSPGCMTKSFKRPADLDRHYKHKHPTSPVEQFSCDYKRCYRSTEPFTRRDHCRDHYRDYHHEDLSRRGSESIRHEPNVSQKWWRCVKCLDRVTIAKDQWQCVRCKTTCDPERRKLRGFSGRSH